MQKKLTVRKAVSKFLCGINIPVSLPPTPCPNPNSNTFHIPSVTGDMDHILETVMCAEIDDEPRFHDKVKQWISEGTIPPFKFVSMETKKKRRERKRRWEAEAVEAEEHCKELGLKTEEGDGEWGG